MLLQQTCTGRTRRTLPSSNCIAVAPPAPSGTSARYTMAVYAAQRALHWVGIGRIEQGVCHMAARGETLRVGHPRHSVHAKIVLHAAGVPSRCQM